MPILEGRGSKAGVPGVAVASKSGAVASLWAHGPIRQYRSAGYSCIQTTRLCRVEESRSSLIRMRITTLTHDLFVRLTCWPL